MTISPATQTSGESPPPSGTGSGAAGAPATGNSATEISSTGITGAATVSDYGAAASAAAWPPTSSENLPKKSSAILRAVPSIRREPIWASLPPTLACTV